MTPRSSTPDVAQRLSAARLQRGLAQKEVARRAGIAASYLSRIENGKVHPTVGTLTRIVRALGADLVEVFGGEKAGNTRGPCPVTSRGHCLLDLIAPIKSEGHFTPREVRLIRMFAIWVERAEPSRLRAMETLLEDLAGVGRPAKPE